MSIFLVTNRSIIRNRISDKGREKALPTFRIAECEIDEKNKSITYNLIKDRNSAAGYEDSIKALDGKINPNNLSGSAYMFNKIYKQMLEASEKVQSDTLFFIHGFNYDLESNFQHIYELYKYYIEPEDSPIDHLIYVSWPSIGNLFATYWNDQEDAEETGKALARLFSKTYGFFKDLFEIHGKERCQHKIHLAAHSMGNQVLKYMLHCIPDHKLIPIFKEVLLLNSDVEWTVFNPGQPFTKLAKVAERTHIYIHRSDDALRISRYTKNFNQRLGFKGPQNRAVLDEETFIMDTTQGTKSKNLKERLIDHWGYLTREDVKQDIRYVLSGMDEDDIPKRNKWNEETMYFHF